jgi:hypothetical protein
VALLLGLGASFPAQAAEENAEVTPEHIESTLAQINTLFENTEYEKAYDLALKALDEPGWTKERAILWLHKGILHYHLPELAKDGKDEFLQAFRIDLDARSPVEGLKDSIIKDMEEARKKAQAESRLPAPPPPQVSSLRKHALIPAVAGGVCVVAGTVFVGMSRGELHKLRSDDARILGEEDARVISSRGQRFQTIGISLLTAGAASLSVATGMYLLGAPRSPKSTLAIIQVSPTGSAVFIQGRWP